MSATLKLERRVFGIELRRGTFSITLDGQEIGSIESRDSTELPIEAGRHVLQLRAGRYLSPSRPFDVPEGDSVSFICHGARIWPIYLASIVKPDLAISLHQT